MNEVELRAYCISEARQFLSGGSLSADTLVTVAEMLYRFAMGESQKAVPPKAKKRR